MVPPPVSFSLRTRILMAVLAAIVTTDALAAWAVNDRLVSAARAEADLQARAQLAELQAVYAERAATLQAEGEAVSLYPAVIAALAGSNPTPLLQWSGQVAALQGIDVTVVDAAGRVVARGHAPDQSGDEIGSKLAGMRLALSGQPASGTEAGDEVGLAVRGYAPVRQNGRDGAVVGAVMIAEPLTAAVLERLSSSPLVVEEAASTSPTCVTDVTVATCGLRVLTPDGNPAATLALSVPLTQIDQALTDAQRVLLLIGIAVLIVGAFVAWFLARSLTRPLARLTSAADRIATGLYSDPVEVRSRDEIGILAHAFETMRQRVAEAIQQLREERDVLDSVLESTGDAILMVGPAGDKVFANSRWPSLTTDLQRVETAQQQTFGEFMRVVQYDAESVAVAEFERHEPTYARFRCYTAPVLHTSGSALGRLFVMRDITRESEAERMRSAFVATVSHELRSPLTAIAGYTDTLLTAGPWDVETQREFLEIVAQSAAKLAGLVDNLLDAAKVEAGVLELQREPVRVERIAQQVVSQRRALAQKHSLQLEVDSDLPLAEADPGRVEQVLANLVDNAIKYSPEGGTITVRVGLADGALRISVSDQGVGVTPEQAERLFERFYRADSSLRRTTRGVGLGLFICRSLVEAHGGRIWVDSKPGRGSTFWFTLPRLRDETQLSPKLVAELAEVLA